MVLAVNNAGNSRQLGRAQSESAAFASHQGSSTFSRFEPTVSLPILPPTIFSRETSRARELLPLYASGGGPSAHAQHEAAMTPATEYTDASHDGFDFDEMDGDGLTQASSPRKRALDDDVESDQEAVMDVDGTESDVDTEVDEAPESPSPLPPMRSRGYNHRSLRRTQTAPASSGSLFDTNVDF